MMEEKEENKSPAPVQARRPDAKEEAQLAAWRAYVQKTQEETPARLEDAAKYLATMISVSFSLFVGVADLKALRATEAGGTWLPIGLVAVLLALALSFLVVFNFKAPVYTGWTAAEFAKWHRGIIRRKQELLVTAMVLFFCGLGTLAGLVLA